MAVFPAAVIVLVLEIIFWLVLLLVAAVFVAALIHPPYNANARSERGSCAAINRPPTGLALAEPFPRQRVKAVQAAAELQPLPPGGLAAH